MRRQTVLLLLAALSCALPLRAATYYVAKNGRDSGEGTTPEQAFLTVTRGVEALTPGDMLIVGPGVYREEVFIEKSGTREEPIVLKAAVPGRTELVGSVRIDAWTPVRGRVQVFRAPLAQPTYLVYEKDTDTEYVEKANLDMAEDAPGSFYYDKTEQHLYVHPSDGLGMQHHVVDACVLDHGLVSLTTDPGYLHEPRRVGLVIDGFVVRDYNTYGIFIHNADYCLVRNCTVHHCRRGIFTYSSVRSRITGCEAFACADRYNREQGNIGMMGYVFECTQDNNIVHDTRQHGIRFYGGHYGNVMSNNLAYRCNIGLHVKGKTYDHANATRLGRFSDGGNPSFGLDLTNRFVNNVCHEVTGSTGLIPKDSIYRRNTGEKSSGGRALLACNNLELETDEMPSAGFAALEWHDLRLQSDSLHRGTGSDGADPGAHPYRETVFFVAPDGSDDRPGTSVASAWRTLAHATTRLEPGHTLYLLPGTYTEPLRIVRTGNPDKPIRIRSRTKGAAIVQAPTGAASAVELVDCTNICVQGLRISGGSGQAALVRRCRTVTLEENDVFDSAGAGLRCDASADIRVMHNTIVFNTSNGIAVEDSAKSVESTPWHPSYRLVNNIIHGNGGGIALDAAAEESLWFDYNNTDAPLPSAPGPHNVNLSPGFADAANRDLRLTPTSMCRGRGYLDQPIGAGRVQQQDAEAIAFDNVRVVGVTDRTVDLAWSVTGGKATVLLAVGTNPEELTTRIVRDKGPWYRRHHTATLRDLQPATRYYLRVGARRLLDGPAPYHSFRYIWPERSPDGEAEYYAALRKEDILGDRLVSFTTREDAHVAAQTWHVATNGLDTAPGTAVHPLLSLGRAAAMAEPGDRVVVHAGTYRELVRPLRNGIPGHPIVFEAAAGERVEINGSRERIPFGFDLKDRHHIVVRGFIFFGQTEHAPDRGGFGQVCIIDASNIRVEQCLFDGRMNYINPVYIAWSSDITIHNNIFVSHHGSILGNDNHGRITVTRNAFLGPTLSKLYVARSQSLVIRNNLFGEHLFPKKKQQYKLKLPLIGDIDTDYNCYYFDPDNDEMRIIDFMPDTERPEETTAQPEDDPRKARIGVRQTLDAWRETHAQGMHSFLADPGWADPEALAAARSRRRGWPNRFFEYEPLNREDFRLAKDSPCVGAGEEGTTIGPDYEY